MIKHVFYISENIVDTESALTQKIEIIVPGTEIIIPDKLAADIKKDIEENLVELKNEIIEDIDSLTSEVKEDLKDITNNVIDIAEDGILSINALKETAEKAINISKIPEQKIYIDSSNNTNIGFYLPNNGVVRNIEPVYGISSINQIKINGLEVTLPTLIRRSDLIELSLSIYGQQQRIKVTLIPYLEEAQYIAQESYQIRYMSFPTSGSFYVPEIDTMLFQGFVSNTVYSYIFDEHNKFYDSIASYGGFRTYGNYKYIQPLQVVYLFAGNARIFPYYPLAKRIGNVLTLTGAGAVYSYAYNRDDNILYVGTSTNVFAINPINNTIIDIYEINYAYYLEYINNGQKKYLYVGRYGVATNNPTLIDLETKSMIYYNYQTTNNHPSEAIYLSDIKKLYVCVQNLTSTALGRINIIEMDPSSPNFLQTIDSITNLYCGNIRRLGNFLYMSQYSIYNNNMSRLNLQTNEITTIISQSPNEHNVLEVHPTRAKVIKMCQSGYHEYVS